MPRTPQPVLLEVLAYVPTDFHCLHCERLFDAADSGAAVRRETRTSYPPEVLEEAGRPAARLQDLSARYGEQLHIQVIDPRSLEGFLKPLRYGVRRYPSFIVNRRVKYTGWDAAALERLLAGSIPSGGEAS
jgi:hypothetical protein